MDTNETTTERVVRHHLQTFLAQTGVETIVADYDDDASFVTEDRRYAGKEEIAEFFAAFLGALPPGAVDRFELRSLRIDGDVAFITWCVDGVVGLGTDTFVVRDGRIVTQTFAMHASAGRPDAAAA